MIAARTLRLLVAIGALATPACRTAATGAGATTAERRLDGDAYVAKKRFAAELVSQREWAAALATIDELRRERPNDPEPLVLRGITLRERGLLEVAEADLRDALALDSKRADAHAALGILLDQRGKLADAESEHRAALALAPDDAGLLNNLGFSLFLHGKPREAVEHLEKAARRSPDNARVRTNLGFAYAATGDFQRASREFGRGGSAVEAKINLGYAYERSGNLARAYDLYVAAVRIDPAAERARTNLEHVCRSMNRALPSDLPSAAPPDAPDKEPAR
jgi:Flp pilus assembly protein TadD